MVSMTIFIKLTHNIINSSKIVKIDVLPTKYIIFMDNHHFFGGMILGSGAIETIQNKIEICKYKLPYDYHVVKEWIENAF